MTSTPESFRAGQIRRITGAEIPDPLDISISYPRYIEWLHGPLADIVQKARSEVDYMHIDRQKQIERIAGFYALSEPTIFTVPSAGEALHTVLQYFTDCGDQIVIPEGSYGRFPLFVESLAGGTRNVRWVDEGDLIRLADQPEHHRPTIALMEEPRGSTLFDPSPQECSLIRAARPFRVVIYDSVNWGFGTYASVLRKGNENRIQWREFPQADARIRVVSTSKLLPAEAFPNVGMIAIHDDVDPEAVAQLSKAIQRKHYQSPSTTDLYVMAEILHSQHFPVFLHSIRQLAGLNAQLAGKRLKKEQVVPDGGNIYVSVYLEGHHSTKEGIEQYLNEFGIHAYHSDLSSKSVDTYHTRIRVPLIMNPSDFEKILVELEQRLELIRAMVRYRQETSFSDYPMGFSSDRPLFEHR